MTLEARSNGISIKRLTKWFQPLRSSDVVAALVMRNAGRLPALSRNVGVVTMALITQAPRHKVRLDLDFH
jgi:hypothetical protein